MAYQAKLRGGQTLVLENDGEGTAIRLSRGGQSQGSSVTTGEWKAPPTLFQTTDGAVVEIHTGDGSVYFQIGDGRLHSLSDAPDVEDAESLELEAVADGTGEKGMKPMAGIEPMKPMKPM